MKFGTIFSNDTFDDFYDMCEGLGNGNRIGFKEMNKKIFISRSICRVVVLYLVHDDIGKIITYSRVNVLTLR